MTTGAASRYFLPDRLLVRDGKHYTDIGSRNLHANGYQHGLVESPTGHPTEARQV